MDNLWSVPQHRTALSNYRPPLEAEQWRSWNPQCREKYIGIITMAKWNNWYVPYRNAYYGLIKWLPWQSNEIQIITLNLRFPTGDLPYGIPLNDEYFTFFWTVVNISPRTGPLLVLTISVVGLGADDAIEQNEHNEKMRINDDTVSCIVWKTTVPRYQCEFLYSLCNNSYAHFGI